MIEGEIIRYSWHDPIVRLIEETYDVDEEEVCFHLFGQELVSGNSVRATAKKTGHRLPDTADILKLPVDEIFTDLCTRGLIAEGEWLVRYLT